MTDTPAHMRLRAPSPTPSEVMALQPSADPDELFKDRN
jgi:hypothetical protein